VRGLAPTSCGADLQVDVDKIGKGELVVGWRGTTFRLCFLSTTNALLPKLTVTELKKQRAHGRRATRERATVGRVGRSAPSRGRR
jgi:hypothetical protein